jgi:hypothetical protein
LGRSDELLIGGKIILRHPAAGETLLETPPDRLAR